MVCLEILENAIGKEYFNITQFEVLQSYIQELAVENLELAKQPNANSITNLIAYA